MKKIVLASSSQRRKDILKNHGIEYEAITSTYEEVLDNFEFKYEKIENLAFCKAKEVALRIKAEGKRALVIGADTVVVFSNQIFGKPKDEADAFKMLKALSGQVHFVVTSICVIDSKTNNCKVESTTSYVEFEELSDELIMSYIHNYKPFDKAGSYGIQELPNGFVKNIDGSLDNIIGLCPVSLNSVLKSFN